MKKIEWTDSLSLKHKKIDDQHKNLLKMFNAIDADKLAPTHSEEFHEQLNALRDYALLHFSTEESIFPQLEEKGYDSSHHKNEHRKFKEIVAKLSIETMNKQETTPLKVFTFLQEWVLNHLVEVDQEMKKYF